MIKINFKYNFKQRSSIIKTYFKHNIVYLKMNQTRYRALGSNDEDEDNSQLAAQATAANIADSQEKEEVEENEENEENEDSKCNKYQVTGDS